MQAQERRGVSPLTFSLYSASGTGRANAGQRLCAGSYFGMRTEFSLRNGTRF